jgi:hypothetical protein
VYARVGRSDLHLEVKPSEPKRFVERRCAGEENALAMPWRFAHGEHRARPVGLSIQFVRHASLPEEGGSPAGRDRSHPSSSPVQSATRASDPTCDRDLTAVSVRAFGFQTRRLRRASALPAQHPRSGRPALAAERARGRRRCRRIGQRAALPLPRDPHVEQPVRLTLRSWLGRMPVIRWIALDIVNWSG